MIVKHLKPAFTLIELLVVVTIIVVLLALLTPALDRALTTTAKAECQANVRNTVQGCQQYALESRRTLPVNQMTGRGAGSSYDLRSPWNGNPKFPMNIGLLVPTGFLPSTQLGKIANCSSLVNTGLYPGHCMDVAHAYGFGGSGWVAHPDNRIIGGYNYRAASYFLAGGGDIKTNRLNANFLLYVDTPDVRFRGYYTLGQVYSHPDGYSRGFGDGSASFLLDPKNIVEQRLRALPNHPEGHLAGVGDIADARNEETIYIYMARGSVAE